MIFLPPFIFCMALGYMATGFFLKHIEVRNKPLLTITLAAPAGYAINSLTLFFVFLVGKTPNASLVMTISAVLLFLSIALFFKGANTTPKGFTPAHSNFSRLLKNKKLTQWLLLLACAFICALAAFKFFDLFKFRSLANPLGGWDAHYFWNVKAKFFFREPSQWRNMFSNDISWSHPDYPLLLPGSVAWGWHWLGQEVLIWPIVVSLTFALSTALLIFWYLSERTQSMTGFIGAAFYLSLNAPAFWAGSQYADGPLAFYMTAAVILMAVAQERGGLKLWTLAGWFAGCAAYTKNEGLLFVALFFLWYGISSVLQKNLLSVQNFKRLIALTAGLFIPILATLIIKKALASSGDYLGSGRSLSTYLQAVLGDGEKTRIIATSFLAYFSNIARWSYLWFFFAAALIMSGISRDTRKKINMSPAALALLIIAGYFTILHTSPHEIKWQIETALERLLLHAAPLALIFSFHTFGASLSFTEKKA